MSKTLQGHIKSLFLIQLGALLLIFLLKEALELPKPLTVFLGVTWAASTLLILLSHKAFYWSRAGLCLRQLTLWIVINGLLFGGLYQLDNGGWLWLRFTGYENVHSQDHSLAMAEPIESFLQRHPGFSLQIDDPTQLVLSRGTYDFEQSVVLPSGFSLTIEPGTTLRFAAGQSLISHGRIVARGDQEEIVFKAKRNWAKWGVVAVINADSESVFENVRFENARWAVVNGIILPGGLSLINSDGAITKSRFVNMYGKDAVYIQAGTVLVQNNFFKNAAKDGLDFDGGQGEIRDNVFISCGDEGIDLSDNFNIEVVSNRILDEKGGRISADYNLEVIRSANSFGRPGRSGESNTTL